MKPEAWRISIAVKRHELFDVEAKVLNLAGRTDPPTIAMDCPDDDNAPDDWVINAYFQHEIPVSTRRNMPTHSYEPVYPQDWITLSQSGMPAITAGRFQIYTNATANDVQKSRYSFRIEAGQAFGTGTHATTCGCLLTLNQLAKQRKFRDVLDLGTGTGILGFAAARLWNTHVIGSDIDPLSISVATENARANALPLGTGKGAIELVVAAGLSHLRLKKRAPYDLVIANILARPLIQMSADISRAVAPGGSLVLAGLLKSQESAVLAAYRARGFTFVRRTQSAVQSQGLWPTLLLIKSGSRLP
jgi:ribosomal protein L11 methyltransferase